MRLRLGLIIFALACASSMAGPDDTRRLDEAMVLYDDGRFAEARLILEEVDARSSLDGPWLYRLAYCQRSTGSDEAAGLTGRRAVPLLEAAHAKGADLEASFYLVSVYRDLGRVADSQRVAGEVTSAVESGSVGVGNRLDSFRVGKLYADLNRFDQAKRWLEGSVEDAAEGALPDAYVRWAGRYLAQQAAKRGDAAALDRHLDQAGGNMTAAELESLAAERARAREFGVAAAAWKRALAIGTTDPNRSRYALSLVEMAAAVEDFPATAPSGEAWGALGKDVLESIMQEQAALAGELLSTTRSAESLDKAERTRYRAERDGIRGRFIAAALEYTLQGHPIRETAFFKGYAPLILKKSAWKLRKPDGS